MTLSQLISYIEQVK